MFQEANFFYNKKITNLKKLFVFDSTGVWTKGFELVKQVLYHLSHTLKKAIWSAKLAKRWRWFPKLIF
jgi:hypothetical protein